MSNAIRCECPDHNCCLLSSFKIATTTGPKGLCAPCYTKGHGWRWEVLPSHSSQGREVPHA